VRADDELSGRATHILSKLPQSGCNTLLICDLIEFYDVEHLQSMDETIDDLLIVCAKPRLSV